MNRKERRMAKKMAPKPKKQPAYAKLTKEQRMDALIKNGITPKDLEKEYDTGYHDGFEAAIVPGFKTLYAAVCIVLHEKYGFGQKRCCETLQALDQYITQTLTSADATQEVFEQLGIEMDFNDPLDRIYTKTPKRRAT